MDINENEILLIRDFCQSFGHHDPGMRLSRVAFLMPLAAVPIQQR